MLFGKHQNKASRALILSLIKFSTIFRFHEQEEHQGWTFCITCSDRGATLKVGG